MRLFWRKSILISENDFESVRSAKIRYNKHKMVFNKVINIKWF